VKLTTYLLVLRLNTSAAILSPPYVFVDLFINQQVKFTLPLLMVSCLHVISQLNRYAVSVSAGDILAVFTCLLTCGSHIAVAARSGS
jgi:hypothetical protein